jgi:hypothetical protein
VPDAPQRQGGGCPDAAVLVAQEGADLVVVAFGADPAEGLGGGHADPPVHVGERPEEQRRHVVITFDQQHRPALRRPRCNHSARRRGSRFLATLRRHRPGSSPSTASPRVQGAGASRTVFSSGLAVVAASRGRRRPVVRQSRQRRRPDVASLTPWCPG